MARRIEGFITGHSPHQKDLISSLRRGPSKNLQKSLRRQEREREKKQTPQGQGNIPAQDNNPFHS